MDRRKFIEKSCLACGALMVGATILSLDSCSASQNAQSLPNVNGYISLPLSAFKEERIQVVKAENIKDKILVVKNPDDTFGAVLLQCTHKGAPLKLEGSANLKCTLHGSLFNYHGDVLLGPAKNHLQRFQAEVVDGQVRIRVIA